MPMVINATDWPEPMKVFDQPKLRTHSSVIIETDWRADITMESVAKHSQTTIHGLILGLIRDGLCVLMAQCGTAKFWRLAFFANLPI